MSVSSPDAIGDLRDMDPCLRRGDGERSYAGKVDPQMRRERSGTGVLILFLTSAARSASA